MVKAVQHPAGSRFFEMISFFLHSVSANLMVAKKRANARKTPEIVRFRGFEAMISFLASLYGTLHQKRYFAFLCYRRLFLLHKPGVKMMTLGLFHFSHWSAIITATEYQKLCSISQRSAFRTSSVLIISCPATSRNDSARISLAVFRFILFTLFHK